MTEEIRRALERDEIHRSCEFWRRLGHLRQAFRGVELAKPDDAAEEQARSPSALSLGDE